MVLQEDASALAACITAMSLALADSGIEMYDLVSYPSIAINWMKPSTKNSTSSTNKSALFLDPSDRRRDTTITRGCNGSI